MAVVRLKGRYNGPDNCHAEIMCPGCKGTHLLGIADGCVGARWKWNGNLDRPTFSPSIISRFYGRVCHSFVIDGNIQFLADCTHELAGKTVPLPHWDK